jgi:hypothetical protein
MLDLQLDRDTGVYLAPLQLKANNGVLVIDDFGRQAMTPAALLNRWIVPLDRQIDYLTLHGRKFEVPFELKVVLSTNLDPQQLGDEAFFRRIHNKIYVGACNDEQFDWILTRVAQKHSLTVDPTATPRLRAQAKARGDGELRAYLPGVVCELALAITSYENVAPHLTAELVDRVLDLYFTQEDEKPAEAPAASPFREPSSDYWEYMAQRERDAAQAERLEARRRVESGELQATGASGLDTDPGASQDELDEVPAEEVSR